MVESEIDRLLNAAMAHNTHKTYATGWKAFCLFRQRQHLGWSPASVAEVRHFIAWLSLRGLSPSTIATYVSGVGYFHKVQGEMDPTKDFLVGKLMEGARRGSPTQDARDPISLPMLAQLVAVLPKICSSTFEAVMFRAVFICAFFGFMRVGEFTVQSARQSTGSILALSDVNIIHANTPEVSAQISFRHAKNNQSGPPQHIQLVKSGDKSVCPVQALLDFMAVRPFLAGPLFCHFDGRPLTRYQFTSVLDKAVKFAGFTGYCIRGHSFRIGAASTALELGRSEGDIRQMGRWRSAACLSYIRPAPACGLTE